MQRDEALELMKGMARNIGYPSTLEDTLAARWALDEIARLELLTAPGVIEGITKSLEDIKAGRGVALEDIDRIAELEARIAAKDAALDRIAAMAHEELDWFEVCAKIEYVAKEGRAK